MAQAQRVRLATIEASTLWVVAGTFQVPFAERKGGYVFQPVTLVCHSPHLLQTDSSMFLYRRSSKKQAKDRRTLKTRAVRVEILEDCALASGGVSEMGRGSTWI